MYQKLCMERFRRIATIEADKFNAEIGEENLLILMGGIICGLWICKYISYCESLAAMTEYWNL